MRAAFANHGVNLSVQEIISDIGMSKKQHIRELAQKHKIQRKTNKIYQNYLDYQHENIHNYCELIPGSFQLYEKLKKNGVKIGITTGFDD